MRYVRTIGEDLIKAGVFGGVVDIIKEDRLPGKNDPESGIQYN